MSDITINILDPNFERAIRREIDKPIGLLYKSDLEKVRKLYLTFHGVKSVQGIEYCTNLEIFYGMKNELTCLDLSKNTKLKELYCNVNELTSLDLSSSIDLEILHCQYNKLTSIDLSNNVQLRSVNCSNNVKIVGRV